jgi:hypothetical protein
MIGLLDTLAGLLGMMGILATSVPTRLPSSRTTAMHFDLRRNSCRCRPHSASGQDGRALCSAQITRGSRRLYISPRLQMLRRLSRCIAASGAKVLPPICLLHPPTAFGFARALRSPPGTGCVSAWNKAPVIGVIVVQTGPQ